MITENTNMDSRMKNGNMNQHQDLISNYMYTGLIPFFIGALGPWIFADYEMPLSQIFVFYSSVIFAFLAGTVWAIALFVTNNTEGNDITRHIHAAIIFSLIPVIGYVLPLIYQTGLLLAAYLSLLFWEKLFLNDNYANWYQQLRHKITFIAVACHMLVIWNLMRQI